MSSPFAATRAIGTSVCIDASISTGRRCGRPRRVGHTPRVVPSTEPHPDLPQGRPFEGSADLRAMEACLAASWNLRRPFVNMTAGDLEWWTAIAPPGTDWSRLVRSGPRATRSSRTAGSACRRRSTGTSGPISRPGSAPRSSTRRWHGRRPWHGRPPPTPGSRRLSSRPGRWTRTPTWAPCSPGAAGRRPSNPGSRTGTAGSTRRRRSRCRPSPTATSCATCASPTTSPRASRCTGRRSRRRA